MKRSLPFFALLCCALPLFAAVSGTVMTPDGQPVAGARVSLYSIENPEARRARLLSANPEAAPLFSAQSDSKGAFSLESPKEPVVELRVSARGYEPLSRRIERDEEAGAIALPRAEAKRGSVKANGKAVANATVVLMYNGAAETIVKTDAEGRYEVPDPKHARSITIVHPDYALLDETSQSFREGIGTLDRTLSVGAPLAGRVVRDDGKTPVAKATVFVNGWPLATSGDDGAFTIARAPAKWSTIIAQSSALVGMRAQTTERPLTIRVAKPATISGRVLDSKTKVPVAGALVRTSTRGGGMRQNDTSWWGATTDAKGNYSFTAAPGAYMLMATHPAYELSTLDINAAAGQSATKEVALTPLARVSGVVMNDEKKPVVAAAVNAQNAGDGMDFMNMRAMMTPNVGTVSGPDGRFSFRVRSDADLKLRANKKGFPPATSDAVKFAPGERRGNFVLTIPSGVEVTGKVTDQSGNPLSGVSVAATPTPAGQRGMMVRMVLGGIGGGNDEELVKTASDGTYSIRVTEGSQDFAFKREGFSTKNVRGKSVSLAGPNVVDATLEPSVEISGRVVRGGAGVEGVTVMSFGFGGGDSADAVTGPDGSFTLRGLSPGSARVMVRKEDDLVNEQRQLTAPARDVVIELPAGVRVSGRVVEKSTKKPVTSFQVGVSLSRSGGGMVMMAPPMLRSVTSDDGSFVLENVPLGAVNFIASAPGYTTTRMNLTVDEGKPITNLEVELDTGVRLFGKITGPDGSPLADANVSLAMIGGPGMNVARATDKRTVTNSSGEYELDALEPGEETIEISHSKYLPERKSVELKGRELRLDVQLTSGSRVSGTVVAESGGPVADADVEAVAAGGVPRRAKTDSGGRFEFDSLSPARYQFSASKAGFVEAVLNDVDVAAGTPVRLVLKSGGVIYGYVRGLSADELSSTTVEARGAESSATATVDASGAYRVEGVPSGTVTVRAMMMGRGFSSRKVSPSQTVEMAPGASRQLDLEYRSDTVIKGRVRRNRQPISGASVMFFPKPGSTQQTSSTTTADEQGNYSVSGLEDGEYSVIVNDMQRFSSHTTTYEVRGSATFDIDHNAYTLRGRVVNAASGDPIHEARVQLRNNSSATGMRFADRTAVTDTNGTFSLDLVSPGNYLVTADKQGFGNDPRDITISDRPVDDLELRLQPSEGMTLKVVDARDGRVLRAQVVVFDMQGRVMNDQRRFMFGDDAASEMRIPLAAGQYQATVAALGYGTKQISLRSPSTQTVALTPAARLAIRSKHSEPMRVRLIDANGLAYPRWSANPPSSQLLPNPATTTIDNLSSGAYTLQLLSGNGMVMDSKQVMLADGQTLEVDI